MSNTGASVESTYVKREDRVIGVREIELEQLGVFHTASTICWSLFTGFLFFGLSYVWNLLENHSTDDDLYILSSDFLDIFNPNIWWDQKALLPFLVSLLFGGLAFYFHKTQRNSIRAILKKAPESGVIYLVTQARCNYLGLVGFFFLESARLRAALFALFFAKMESAICSVVPGIRGMILGLRPMS